MRRVAIVIAVMLGFAAHAGATTLNIEFGGIASDTSSRDVYGNYGGSSFTVVGAPIIGVLGFGLAPNVTQLAEGRAGVGATGGSVITVAGLGNCTVILGPSPCHVGLELISEPFTAPPPATEFMITVPFAAVGQLGFAGTDFDVVGGGLLTVIQSCFCSDPMPIPSSFITVASYAFVPEPTTLTLTTLGLGLSVAVARYRRRKSSIIR